MPKRHLVSLSLHGSVHASGAPESIRDGFLTASVSGNGRGHTKILARTISVDDDTSFGMTKPTVPCHTRQVSDPIETELEHTRVIVPFRIEGFVTCIVQSDVK